MLLVNCYSLIVERSDILAVGGIIRYSLFVIRYLLFVIRESVLLTVDY